MGTGFCSADYDGREQWKQAITSPPPGEESLLSLGHVWRVIVFSMSVCRGRSRNFS